MDFQRFHFPRRRNILKGSRPWLTERLEPRVCLAANLVAHWVADDAQEMENGSFVSSWFDRIDGLVANADGTPTLAHGVLNGRDALNFSPSDGNDAFRVDKAINPLSNADDFSVAVVFSTSSSTLQGGTERWFDGTGLVDSSRLGFAADWGIAINSAGQVGAGVSGGFGRPTHSVFSSQANLNDGEIHQAIFTRSGGTLSLQIDDGQLVSVDDADGQPRIAADVTFGSIQSDERHLDGQIGEVRFYDAALDASEIAQLRDEFRLFYQNALPIAVDDEYTLQEDDSFFFVPPGSGILQNDGDADGDSLTASVISEPAHGRLTLQPDGSFFYIPNENFFGVDSFTYAATDFRPSNAATVTLTITEKYDPATGIADSYRFLPNQSQTIPQLIGVLQNDLNVDGLPITAILDTAPEFGNLTLNANGSFSFDPLEGSGVATFSYRIDDTVGLSDPVSVRLIVNSAPVASDDSYIASEDAVFTVPADRGVLANDFDGEDNALSVSLVDSPAHGELTIQPDGSFIFRPEVNFFGDDRFTYRIADEFDTSESATVTLTVAPVNDAPIALPDSYFTSGGERIEIPGERGVLANDFDIEESTLSASLHESVKNGTVELNSDGSFSYQPTDGFSGQDSFVYYATDEDGGSATAEVKIFVDDSPVRISEFLAANSMTLPTKTRIDPENRFGREDEFYDWIEIENLTSGDVDIEDFHLTDNMDRPTKWQFPPDTIVPANGYLIVFASGKDISDLTRDEQGILHTNFKLSNEADGYLGLYSPLGDRLMEISAYPPQRANVSYGFVGEELLYQTEPSPAAESLTGIAEIVSTPTVSVAAGYFQSEFEVEVSSTEPGALVRFTTDGSEPTLESGNEYQGALSITRTTTLRTRAFLDGKLPSDTTTSSYLFLDNVLTQPDAPDGFPATWGRAGAADYGIDPRIATDTDSQYYDPDLRDALQSHDAISIVTDLEHLFDRTTGIYANPQSQGFAWERPASMELFTSDGNLEVQLDAGLRIQGGASRNPNRPKHNMRLLFKELYGPSKLEYPLFADGDVERFDTIIFRGGNGDSWFHPNSTQQNDAQYIRDQWHRDLQKDMGHLHVAQRYIHLYINGLYWGFYHIFEKPNASFFSERFGGKEDDYDVIQHAGGTVDGNRDAWNDLIAAARDGLENDEPFERVAADVNLPSFIDYLLINFYSGNVDWDQNNWFGGRQRAGGEWNFFTWDAERTFLGPRDNRVTAFNRNQPTELHREMSANTEYRMMFADHVHRHFFNDGLLTPQQVDARWSKFADEIELPLTAESARWGDNKRRSRPYTPDNEWKAELEYLKTRWFPGRTELVLDQLRRRDLYPDIVAPSFSQHGGEIPENGLTVTMDAPDGTIYFTTDGSDPRLQGGEVRPDANEFTAPILLRTDTVVRSRVLIDGEWSAMNEAEFLVAAVPATIESLRISEIHYNPADPTEAEIQAGFSNNNDFEFIELVNISDTMISLDNVALRFSSVDDQIEGVEFDFEEGEIQRLPPGQRVVVVEDVDAFAHRYGPTNFVTGQWTGRLANRGETLTLAINDVIVMQFQYDDEWHPETDGPGLSLEIIDAASSDLDSWGASHAWRPSDVLHGTPGDQGDSGHPIPGDSNRDGIFNSSDLVLVFQAGEFEDDLVGNSTFEEGDWDGDGDFTTRDLVLAFQSDNFSPNALIDDFSFIDHHVALAFNERMERR